MVMEMCLVGFLKTFSVKIFSQTNQKMETIKSRFQLKIGTSFPSHVVEMKIFPSFPSHGDNEYNFKQI